MLALSVKKRAVYATLIFALFGALGVFFSAHTLATAWPLILFYALLVWNDYYSVEHFSKIIPPNKTSQVIIDIALTFLHLVSALSFANPLRFAIAITILFILAVLKYSYDLGAARSAQALHRKIKIDCMGALMNALALTGIIMGFAWPTMIIWASIFVCASVYVIFINPLYKESIGTI
jgi:hypothetical protein